MNKCLESAQFYGPTLSLLADGETLLVGEGSSLKRKTGNETEEIAHMPEANAIHGITKSSCGDIAIFGSKSLVLVPNSNRFRQSYATQMEDWIHAVRFLADGRLICLLAHNFAVCVQPRTEAAISAVYRCEEKCILYSGHIEGCTQDSLIFFSGTVFQEIVIWSPDSTSSDDECSVLHRLKGHQGVIFSVTFSEEKHIICSTSDDRSVRTWTVRFPDGSSSRTRWRDALIEPQLVLHGHSARVWRSLLLEKMIVSAGEDSYICLWSYEGELLDKWVSHDGASVRSVSYSEEKKLLYSSGDDGGIFAWTIEDRLPVDPKQVTFPVDRGHPNRVLILPSGDVIVIASGGELLRESSGEWKVLLGGVKSRNNSALVKANEEYLCLGEMTGRIRIYSTDKLEEDEPVDVRATPDGLASVTWIARDTLLACGNRGDLWILTVGNRNEFGLFLPYSKDRISSAASWISGTNALVVGDREGNLFVYDNLVENCIELQDPVFTLKSAHGKVGVSHIVSRSEKLVLSAGRDGSVKTFLYDEQKMALRQVSSVQCKNGFVTRFLDYDVQLAFHGNYFVVKTGSDDRVLASIPCGGAQRSWDYHQGESVDKFAFIKQRSVYQCDVRRSAYERKVIKLGLHSRIINTAIVESLSESDSLLVTGSEDTSIGLSRLTNCQLVSSKKYKIHRSSVRALAVKRVEEGFFLVSGGGRAELCVSVVSHREDDLNLVHQCSHMLRGLVASGFDPETRYNDLQICDDNEESFFVYAACSDGTIRKFSYSTSNRRLIQLAQTDWHSHCLLQLRLSGCKMLSAATDGRIAIWALESFPTAEPEGWIATHQSGVNDFDILEGGGLLVASGGDDGALCVQDIGGSGRIWRAELAHAAQITGLKAIGSKSVITVSADQRIAIWGLSDEALALTSIVCSQICDIHGVCLWDSNVLVYGNGFEIHNFVSSPDFITH